MILGLSEQTGKFRLRRSGMSGLSFFVGAILWVLVIVAVGLLILRKDDTSAVDPTSQPAVPKEAIQAKPKTVTIGFPTRELPEFEFPECMGGTVSRESLRGKRWLASFVFTRCVETCPTITRSVSELHTRVATSNPDFLFVTFSVDSSFDSAEVLRKYADTFRADHDRWKFLTGDENEIHDLIRRGFAQFVQATLGELRKPGFEVAHSNRAVLVNEDGIPVATYLMTDPGHVVKLRRVIEGKEEFPEAGPFLKVTPTDGENPPVPLNLVPVEDSVTNDADPDPQDSGKPAPGESRAESPTADEKTAIDNKSGNETPDEDADSLPVPEESAENRNERIQQNLPVWVTRLPVINASLNSVCTVLLIAGFVGIRAGKRTLHRNLMISAFLVSVAFLACYVTYHEALFRFTGERGRAFVGSPLATMVYRGILIPHVILAVFVPFLAIRVFVHAYRQRWVEHRRLAKITLPIWLFVSITGVVIYWMLYHWPWRNLTETMALGCCSVRGLRLGFLL